MLGIVLAAGSGSRLGYLGGILPKAMVPVRGRPLLWYALNSLSSLGADDAVVATRADTRILRAYVKSLDPADVSLNSLRVYSFTRPTHTPVETLRKALGRPPNGPFAVVLGDDFTVAQNLSDALPDFLAAHATVAEAVVVDHHPDALRRTCAVRLDGSDWIQEIHEKPRRPRSAVRGCGLYLFDGARFSNLLRRAAHLGKVASLTDLVSAAAVEGGALAFRLRGRNINVNTVNDLLDAWQMAPQDRHEAL